MNAVTIRKVHDEQPMTQNKPNGKDPLYAAADLVSDALAKVSALGTVGAMKWLAAQLSPASSANASLILDALQNSEPLLKTPEALMRHTDAIRTLQKQTLAAPKVIRQWRSIGANSHWRDLDSEDDFSYYKGLANIETRTVTLQPED
jgi:hypothetical protein